MPLLTMHSEISKQMSRKIWSESELEALKIDYPNTDTSELAVRFNCSIGSVHNKAFGLNLKKSKEYIANTGYLGSSTEASKATRFKKGNESWNQGQRGLKPWMKGMFEKGAKPANTLYDGAITLRAYGEKNPVKKKYYYIRLENAKWVPLHRHLWEEKNGKIPPKHIVAFKDGNPLNCVIDNLELMTMKENALRNHNAEKAAFALNEYRELGIDINGSVTLSDSFVAGVLAKGDKELKSELLTKHPSVITLKRNQLLLNRQINDEERIIRKA